MILWIWDDISSWELDLVLHNICLNNNGIENTLIVDYTSLGRFGSTFEDRTTIQYVLVKLKISWWNILNLQGKFQ